MVTRRSIESELDDLRDGGRDPSQLELWVDFIEGAWVGQEPEEIHPQIRRWISAADADPKDPTTVPAYVSANRAGLIEHPDGIGEIERRAREAVIEHELRRDVERSTGTEADH